MTGTDMFKHTNRNNPVILAGLVPVILKFEANSIGQTFARGPVLCIALLFDRQSHAGDVGACRLGQ